MSVLEAGGGEGRGGTNATSDLVGGVASCILKWMCVNSLQEGEEQARVHVKRGTAKSVAPCRRICCPLSAISSLGQQQVSTAASEHSSR
jgi:hypothetical protein